MEGFFIISLAKTATILVLFTFIAMIPEKDRKQSPFFEQQRWTLKEAYMGLPAAFILSAGMFVQYYVWFIPISNPARFVYASLFCSIIIGIFYVIIYRKYNAGAATFGLERAKCIKFGVPALNFVLILFMLQVGLGITSCPETTYWPKNLGIPYFLFTMILLDVLTPICKQLFFIGIMYAPVARKIGKWEAVIVLSILSGLFNPVAEVRSLIIASLGWLVLYSIYTRTESLIAPIVLAVGFTMSTMLFKLLAMLEQHFGPWTIAVFGVIVPFIVLVVIDLLYLLRFVIHNGRRNAIV